MFTAAGHHRRLVGKSPREALPRLELQEKCAGAQLLRRVMSPPNEVGVLWSMVKLSGALMVALYWIGPRVPRQIQQPALFRSHSAR